METCNDCKEPIEDGEAMTVISEGVANEGVLDCQNTEVYHSDCLGGDI